MKKTAPAPSGASRKPRADGERTKEAILAAAEEEFAANGFAAASVRGICQKAGCNIALANRYFGSKEELYTAVCEHLFGELSKPMVGLAKTVSNRNEWRKALETWIDDFLYMTMAGEREQKLCAALFRHEVFAPSKWAAKLKKTFGKPVYDSLGRLLAMAGISGDELELWTASVWAQVAIYALADGFWLKSFRPAGVSLEKWMPAVKDHILKTVFASLKYKG